MRKMPLIALSERLYRALLILYPGEYRREYGDLMVQVFRDMSRDKYRGQGRVGLALWWCAALLDLSRTVIEQRRGVVMAQIMAIRSKSATVISIVLCLPLFLSYLFALNGLESPFMQLMYINGYQPTILGRVIMLGMIFSLPAAFVINLLGMVVQKNAEHEHSFRLSAGYLIVGISILVIVLATFFDGVRYELRAFVAPLGSAAIVGQAVFFLGLLALPTAFLLLPRFAHAGLGGRNFFQPTSINLIIGAVILLVIVMLVSGFALEAVACASGVPNCD
jgi:hypothetical protein